MQTSGGRIVENTMEKPLSTTVLDMLEGAESVWLAVGYLFLEGLQPLMPAFRTLDNSYLLIGNVVNRLSENEIQAAQAAKTPSLVSGEQKSYVKTLRDERDRTAAMTALNLRRTIEALPATPAIVTMLVEMASLIADGKLHVRLYTAGRVHAKVALVSYPAGDSRSPGAAIVGSSNITLPADQASLDIHCDVDVLLEGAQNFAKLTEWFDGHWSDAQDFRKDLFEELVRSWPALATKP
jgi:hypothetical protein